MSDKVRRTLRVLDLGGPASSVAEKLLPRRRTGSDRPVVHKGPRKYKRVLLVSPPAVLYKGDLPRCTYPLGPGYIASVLEEAGYEVAILDCLVEGYENASPVDQDGSFVRYGLSAEAIRQRIVDYAPDLIGVSSIFSNQADVVHEIFALAKSVNEKIVTCIGGAHARYFPDMVLSDPCVDHVFLGESEFVFLQFCEALNSNDDLHDVPGHAFRRDGKVLISSDAGLISGPKRNAENDYAELDVIPFPAFHLYNMERYFGIGAYQSPYTKGNRVAQILTSRGCSAKCTFCTTTNFWGNKLRRRSPANVRQELTLLKSNYRINEFHIQDDNLTNDMEHARKMISSFEAIGLPWATPQGLALWRLDEDLIDRMVASGAYQLTFAIESGVQRVLEQLIRKPLDLAKTSRLIGYARKKGLLIHGFFIIGMPPMFDFPGETIEEMHATYQFALEAGFTSASFFTATPIVGSALLQESMRQGFIRDETPLYRMSYKQGLIDVPGLWKGEEVRDLAVKFNTEFNTNRVRDTRRQWSSDRY